MWGSDWESMFCIILFFIFQATECFVETYKYYLLIAWASKQPICRYRRPFFHSIWKIHWELTVKKHQYCFANISGRKALISMKFYLVINYYLVSLCLKLQEDPCINARARVVNARVHFLSRVRLCVHIYARIFMKFEILAQKIINDHHIKFNEDRSFRCGDTVEYKRKSWF